MNLNNEADALLHWQQRTNCNPPATRCKWHITDDLFLIYDATHRFIGAVTPEGDCLDPGIVTALRGLIRG